jgi:hypothetical protein
MRVLLILVLVLAASSAGAQENEVQKVPLETGIELQIKEIPFSRILPTAYYDQAMASIPAVYPGSEIVAGRRFGRFGPDVTASYSLVCYKESSEIDQVTISGVLTSDGKAWSFDALVEGSLFTNTLILVLEALAALPSKE